MDNVQKRIMEVLVENRIFLSCIEIRDKVNEKGAPGHQVSLRRIKASVAKLEAAGKLMRPDAFLLAEYY